jgi:hypothetical protein
MLVEAEDIITCCPIGADLPNGLANRRTARTLQAHNEVDWGNGEDANRTRNSPRG